MKKKRHLLNKNKEKNADKMIIKHDHKRNKKSVEFKVNDLVTVKIPRIDRGGTDFCRLPGKICKVSGDLDKFYRVLTSFGILADCYRASDLETYCGVVGVDIIDYESKYKIISLTEAAKLQSASTGSIEEVNSICNCGTICKGDNRCKCFKANRS